MTTPANPRDASSDRPGPEDWLALDVASDSPVPLHDNASLRRLEQDARQRLAPFTLMSRAGGAAARWLTRHAPPGMLLMLAGPGNNGGDAVVAATRLHETGRPVEIWLIGDPARLPSDAARAWHEAVAAGVPRRIVSADDDADALACRASHFAALVDGLLGIGLNRPVEGRLARWIGWLRQRAADGLPVFALDVPSGLSADTGRGEPAVHAVRTLTFIAAKPGLLTLDGRDCAGALDIAPLGLDYPPALTPTAWASTPAQFASNLPARTHATHKGSFGTVAVIGGNVGMVGAPLLGARAALHLGAGRVHIGFLATPAPLLDPVQPELMLHPVQALDLDAMSALVAGPGMGKDDAARAQLERVLRAQRPLVIDADALNLLSADATLADLARMAPVPRVLTPHPLEAARLAGCGVGDIQRDRLAAARALAHRWQSVVVLKGSGTVIATPDGTVHINPTGNAGLATAGTGDVLAGFIGALLAQGMPAPAAARAAVWLHGAAAQRLTAAGAISRWKPIRGPRY
ncbi:hydroxyethylthiazole kinase-like uncharacterized protein yjeF/hydroxyethylthiazole kinase-like uncharacterized protein yjeF [Cupriavidus gilardii J11]|uniref:Bifunctional NAD(P)H-hydrate repair enzyme n=1 Tax=Cupriavidus gilardii J11 TaxID=936133 RepID=A0A562B6J1_9BURK|nr:NAD(P)H-hydrate dehydratase [Cupriavidus gilardii]TWG80500.1 hydroxyethylthiazole kinase-like uncharacterized protein yjeF/hydroxyethylthiazole kinase-like uncharacterized protein yjeF [Cupriavidus gilardii J11]